jgi:hypothetical protein
VVLDINPETLNEGEKIVEARETAVIPPSSPVLPFPRVTFQIYEE